MISKKFTLTVVSTFILFALGTNILHAQDTEKPEKTKTEKTKTEKEPKAPKTKTPKALKNKVVDPRAPKPYKSWSITVAPGITTSFADIKKKDFLGAGGDPVSENQFGINAFVTKMFSGAFGLQGQFYYGKLAGVVDDEIKNVEDRTFFTNIGITDPVYFESTVIQGSANLYWNISNTIFGMNRQMKAKRYGKPLKDRIFSLYTYVGIGLAQYDAPQLLFAADDQPVATALLTPIPAMGENQFIFYSQDKFTELVMPFGVGAKFKLSKSFDLGVDVNTNFAFTDKIDGFIYDHPNRTKNDQYVHAGVALTYKIGTKKKNKEHYEWVNTTESMMTDFARMEGKVDKISRDDDNDGVSNAFDKEENTPEGAKVDGSGVSMDVDYDGIPDMDDLEMFSDNDAVVDDFGKSLDSDQDGVPDHRDREANTPKGAFVNFEGVTIESKLDIPDPSSLRSMNLPSIYFDYNRTTIQGSYDSRIAEVARTLKENQGLKLFVIGHTDEKGSEPYNEGLARRRAERVANTLIENYSIPASSLIIVSKGETEPLGRKHKINRRVDFKVAE